MVKGRERIAPATEREIERFAARAEQPVIEKKGLPAWKVRNKAPKAVSIPLRLTKTQATLLRDWADEEEISQQKLLERLVLPQLEEERGHLLSPE